LKRRRVQLPGIQLVLKEIQISDCQKVSHQFKVRYFTHIVYYQEEGVSKGHPFSMGYFIVKWLLLRKNPSSLPKHPTEGCPSMRLLSIFMA
jgi:hypothetical protein